MQRARASERISRQHLPSPQERSRRADVSVDPSDHPIASKPPGAALHEPQNRRTATSRTRLTPPATGYPGKGVFLPDTRPDPATLRRAGARNAVHDDGPGRGVACAARDGGGSRETAALRGGGWADRLYARHSSKTLRACLHWQKTDQKRKLEQNCSQPLG